MDRGAWRAIAQRVAKVGYDYSTPNYTTINITLKENKFFFFFSEDHNPNYKLKETIQ